MPEIRIPLDADRNKVLSDEGHYLDIYPIGHNANFLSSEDLWCECDTSSVIAKQGEGGSSRDVYDKLPLTVGIRTDSEAGELITLQ